MNHTQPAGSRHESGHRLIKIRDRQFMDTCRRLCSDPSRHFRSARALAAAAAREPAPMYYVTFDRALRVVREFRNHNMLPKAEGGVREKWADIIDRTCRLCERHGISDFEALTRVLQGGAPSFYLKPGSALRLYHRLRHERRRGSAAAAAEARLP